MPPSSLDLDYAVSMVRNICAISGKPNLIVNIQRSFRDLGLLEAIRRHDSDAIFDWLVEAISYQGISDSVAAGYIEEHGIATAQEIRDGLGRRRKCPKLSAYWTFEGCGYRKWATACNEPSRLQRCRLPRHELRNGSLNQASYSLFLFMRDVAGDDLVGWIDRRLDEADEPSSPIRSQLLRDAVVGPLLHVHGVSHKVLHMTLASLLLAGDGRRKRWRAAGAAMVAIDTLVHNWLWRTGIMRRLGTAHPYGTACYGEEGCEAIINRLSREIDARTFNPSFPQDFPRFVQRAIWSFCAGSESNICNGNNLNDRAKCAFVECPVFGRCERVRLGRIKSGQQ